MRIVLAPDSFKESMTAAQAAAAMARGVRSVLPGAECVLLPMADGGEGTTAAVVAAAGGTLHPITVDDPLGRPVQATWGWLAGSRTAVVEAAAAVGLALLTERDPTLGWTGGLAELVTAALRHGPDRLLVGLGGTATVDGGLGLLCGLGAVPRDGAGRVLAPTPAALDGLATIDLGPALRRLSGVRVEVACDVDNPLLGPRGAATIYGPQKGATAVQVPLLEARLSRLGAALAAATGRPVGTLPGAGAAGGLGAALLALGAHLSPGVQVVGDLVGLPAAVAGADLVLTGEGSLDATTLAGKAPAGVVAVARAAGVPAVVLAGRVGPGGTALLAAGAAAVVQITPPGTDLPTALAHAEHHLQAATARMLRQRLGLPPA